VSPDQGLPGDALSPYDDTEQVNNYVVDLAPFYSSWGTRFGIAPILKSSKLNASFFNGFINAQAMSHTLKEGAPFVRNSYAYWRGQGFGINGSVNTPPMSINTNGFVGNQFALGFSGSEGDANNIIGAVVNYLPQRPSRLYVSRVVAGTNAAVAGENRSQFGFGAVDSDGNIIFRADDFGIGGPNPIVGNNWFRVDLAERDGTSLNVIDGSGGSDATATDWVLVSSSTTHGPASVIPEQIAGRSVIAGTNFNTEYVFESSPNVLSTSTAHRTGSSDQRGTPFYSDVVVVPNDGNVGTMGMFGKDAGGLTRRILLWGVGSNGAPNGIAQLEPPSTIIDNDPSEGGFSFPNGGNIDEFIHHVSQVGFRGGNGVVSIGMDQAGRALVAVPVVSSVLAPSGENPINGMAVARFTPGDPGNAEWTLAAWNDFPVGKQILDGPDGNPIGQIVELNQVTGGSPFGPSLSAATIDSVGNLWFLSAVEIYPRNSPNGRLARPDFDVALVRAVYNPDEFSYQLELVAEVGQVFFGQNSITRWQLRFLSIADNNSVSSGGIWSGNILRTPVSGIDPASLDPADPRTFGGLVLQAQIVYDVNNDGRFIKVTGSGGDPGSLDQEYNCVLFIGPTFGDDKSF
jgi:hypothetical protein